MKKKGLEYAPIDIFKDFDELMDQDKQIDYVKVLRDGHYTTEELLNFASSRSFLKKKDVGKFNDVNNFLRERKEQIYFHMEEKPTKTAKFSDYQSSVRDYICIPGMVQMWAKYRQIYQPDKDFAEALLKTEEVKIPIEILNRIAYQCFYIDFSNVAQFRPFIGSYVYVTDCRTDLVPGLAFVRVVETDTPGKYSFRTCYFSADEMARCGLFEISENGDVNIVLNRKMFREAETLSGSKLSAFGVKEDLDAIDNDNLTDMLVFLLNCVLYLCSDQPDLMQTGTRKLNTKRQSGKVSVSKELDAQSDENTVQLNGMGLRYGNVIRAQKSSGKTAMVVSDSNAVSATHRKKPIAHTRCAHWHTYHVGEGRKEVRVKWLAPIFVNGEKQTKTIVHKMRL